MGQEHTSRGLFENNSRRTIYNCHTHTFTVDHVPKYVGKGLMPLGLHKILSVDRCGIEGIVKRLDAITKSPRWVKWLKRLFGSEFVPMLKRYVNLGKYADNKGQLEIFQSLLSYYPRGTKFVVLTMDMEYMEAGPPAVKFAEQLDELAAVKADPYYGKLLHPFIFADPRRANIGDLVKFYIEEKGYTGIKLYPALGYYPFDPRLMEVYEYACKNEIPLMTHCVRGIIYYRGKKKAEWNQHPIIPNLTLPEESNGKFTVNFTHPLNYECLMNPNLLHPYLHKHKKAGTYKGTFPDLSKLKMCLGHWGGEDEWKRYMTDPWLSDDDHVQGIQLPLNANTWKKVSWFSIIAELIEKYPDSLFVDISDTLAYDHIYPLLKVSLVNPTIRRQVLFGTDFFVVAGEDAERSLSIKLRAEVGENAYWDIAQANPERYLSSKIHPNP